MQSEQEFNLAVEQYLNMVYRIALNWFGSVHDAEDAAQPCADEPEAQAVVEEILRLPKKYRVPLYLYHYEGYSVREISALLKANPSTIRTRLSRARELLKHQLEEG